MNLIIHTHNGGILKLEVEPHRITMSATDDGPGIPDTDQVFQPGYSTATEQVREMGFGAGMGLVNMKRCVDEIKTGIDCWQRHETCHADLYSRSNCRRKPGWTKR